MQNTVRTLKLTPGQDTEPIKAKISVRNVNNFFKSAQGKITIVLRDVNLEICDHEFVAIVGPSGCGKSTLLNMMAGLIKPDNGEVLFDGSPVERVNSKVGYISQADALMPWRTVIENIELGLEIKRVPRKERRSIAGDLIGRVGLGGFEASYPRELSGGMRKRVDIMRILALEPEVLLMDEPFGPLDVFTREMLQDDILRIWQETKKTIVFVTHDLAEAITLADRVILMTARPSTIKADYHIPLARPRSAIDIRFAPQFIKLHKLIWNDLRDEVCRAKGGE